jgi:hypothetical protein
MVFQDLKFLLTTLIVGVVLILCASSNFYTGFEYETVESQITNIDYDKKLKKHTITVNYVVNAVNYTNSIMDETLPNENVGDYIKINYLKNNPNNIILYTNKTKTIIYSSLAGLVLLFLSYIAFFQVKRDFNRMERDLEMIN